MNVVLIIEDEVLEQDFLREIALEYLDSKDILLTCSCGSEAIELSKKYNPNIIITDLIISEIDGLTAISEIRKFLPNSCISIISGCSEFSYAQKAIGLKVFDYLLKPVKPRDFKNLLKRMIDSYEESLKNVSTSVELVDTNINETQKPFIEDALKYIKENFKEKLSLDMVANKLFMNPKYFSFVFKKETGLSFTDYIVNLKIEYACNLLENTSYPSYRISAECGFSDPSYFNRVFCKKMNITPQGYRRSLGFK